MVAGKPAVMNALFRLGIRRFAALPALLALGLAHSLSAAETPIRNSECMDCHNDHTLIETNAVGRAISYFVDEAKLKASVHATNSCISCHADLTRKHPDDNLAANPVDCAKCHANESASYGASVHGVASRNHDLSAARCSDCHDGHNVLSPDSPDSPLNFAHLAATCGACHDQEAKDVEDSVHGQATAAGHRDAPTCTHCHSEHKIEALKGKSPLDISLAVCSKCHASEQLNTKYNLPADRVQTFFQSYHGLANQYGSTVAADCASCHGFHRILPSNDPRSTINQAHLVATCGKCHPGATDNFAFGKIHVAAPTAARAGGTSGEQINWWVRRMYLVLIVGVIGAMLLHNGGFMAKKLAVLHRANRPILRMTRGQRAQHAVLAISFIVLAITGFALKFPDSWIALALGSSESFRRIVHRVAAVIMLAGGAYHVAYVLFTKDGRKLVKDFCPGLQDAKDLLTNVHFLAGLGKNRAPIGRFGYAEKMEYWAVVWGTIIMGATGLMIWLKMDVTRFLPRWAVDVAFNIHYYEAILACLAIIVWHFYHVIFDPDVYPANLAFWDGCVSEHWQQEEHALEKLDTPTTPPATPKAQSTSTAR
jgi:cytochrome b subunit of formate dehydrogenase